ncbi:MAG: hypothetical protein AAGF26_01440 [Cyanobacteria bacterium P01_G01_bin.49]
MFNITMIRNYIIFSTIVILTTIIVTDTFHASSQSGQQYRLKSFQQIITTSLVSYLQKLGR